ncbi:MAG TPA: glycosyltransferase [Candidatus Polarisedimenticolia bacterium]|jgi:glycosyltransferase involved in cell wall biosynthesis|nr:glycosyltransferase [Candidatus Polarisedimenticolia bacterium]
MSSSSSLAQQQGQSDSTGTLPRFTKTKVWRVIHACEYARDVLPVVEGQVAVGMRPFIVTPQGAGTAELYLSGGNQDQPRSLSLLRSWQDVRNWRKSLLDCAPETTSDLVHAHCFAAGMAAVRNCSCVVYDLGACIEEMAISAGLCESGSWMGRSFRVAEQFVLSRAAAVIVHSRGLKEAALERGAPPDAVFLVPEPISEDNEPPALSQDIDFLTRRFGFAPGSVSFFVPQFALEEQLSPAAVSVLEGFALASNELPQFNLLLEAPESARRAINEHASRLGISLHVALVHQFDVPATMESAHVVVAMGELPANPVAARQPNEICLKSLWQGKTLLAADVPRNRDASPEGRGCLWFEADNPRDLGYRMAFVGRKPEFRAALGAAGRMFIYETRNFAAIGQQYDEAYRFAASRKKSSGVGPNMIRLETAENWG